MAFRKRQETREQKRYTRRATKKRSFKSSVRPWQVITLVLCGMAGIVLALVWGNHLKAKSDAFRDGQSDHDWTVDTNLTESIPVSVPDIRAVGIKPEGNVGDILIAGNHGGVILSLCDGDGIPQYASAVGSAAGLPIPQGVPSLSDDIARVSRRGLNITCVYTLTCFSASDAASATYQRGLDLALLRECAEAGPDDILIVGLPAGSDTADRRAVEFLTELNTLLSDLPNRPAIGVALPPSAFAGSEADKEDDTSPLYAGNISPSRLRSACDYLAMDLRSMSAVGVSDLLPHIQYAYVRHSLRLLVNPSDGETVKGVLSHGFERVFELEPTVATVTDEETEEFAG